MMEIFISQAELAGMVQDLAAQVSRDYAGKRLLLVCVLKGAFVFLADLVRALTIPCEVEFVTASSYRNSTEPGKLEVLQDLSLPLEDYDVLVVDDILDSGNTLSVMLDHLQSRNPRSLALCALLDKPSRRLVPVQAKYVGKQIPDAFVVGYGLDYAQQYRHLPHIAVLNDENN
ncbi:MAG: hypoxanthine phosphoribosyltransferase [Oscillospiraceae bacterium]|nr:hypoxanthine phosphoribosyltransferase [Oscillospiraceae bacterium]